MASPWVNQQPAQPAQTSQSAHSPWVSPPPSQTASTPQAAQAPPGLQAMGTNDPLTALWQTSMLSQQSVQQLVQAQLHSLQVNEAQRGFGQLRPKKEVRAVECLTDRGCMTERIEFEIDVEELGAVKGGEVAFKQLRSVAKAPAKDVIELYLAQGTGRQLLEQAAHLPAMPGAQGPRHLVYSQLYSMVWNQLESSVNLTPERRTVIADSIMHEAKMLSDDVAGAEAFIRAYRVGELALVRAGLRPDGDTLLADSDIRALRADLQSQLQALVRAGQQRDLNVMMEQKISKSVFSFIRSLAVYDQPTTPHEVIQCLYRWIESQRRSQNVTMNPPVAAGSRIQALHTQAAPPHDTSMSLPPSTADGFQQSGPSEDVYVAAVDGSFHYIGALTRPFGISNSGNARRLASSNFQSAVPPTAGAGKCPECQGVHADVKQCPGNVARNDPGYKLIPGSKMLCKWKCFGKHPCEGNNHFSKHRRQQLKAERGQRPTLKGKGKGKGKPRGQYIHIKGKGKGKHISSMSADGMCTYWVDDDGSWYDTTGTYLGADEDGWSGESYIANMGTASADLDEDEVVLDNRLAECQQDELTDLQSFFASLPVASVQSTDVSPAYVSPVVGSAHQMSMSTLQPAANEVNAAGSMPSVATGESPQAKAWSQGQTRMSSMRKLASMVRESGPGASDSAGSAGFENAGGNQDVGNSMFQSAGGTSAGGDNTDGAGSSKAVAGGLHETSHVEGILGQDWTTVFR